jgi:hypothetical protein
MKINIKNLLFQPLALHLATDGEGLHLSARECREILTEHVSEEIERAAARGLVSLIDKVGDGLDHALGGEAAKDAPESTAPVDEPQGSRKKGKVR